MTTKKVEVVKTKLLIKGDDGTRVIEIPSDWKVTFGYLHGGAEKGRGHYDDGKCLRIYETKEKQRAVFTNVKAFVDLSIPIKKLVKDRKAISEVLHKRGVTDIKEAENITELWIDEYAELDEE